MPSKPIWVVSGCKHKFKTKADAKAYGEMSSFLEGGSIYIVSKFRNLNEYDRYLERLKLHDDSTNC